MGINHYSFCSYRKFILRYKIKWFRFYIKQLFLNQELDFMQKNIFEYIARTALIAEEPLGGRACLKNINV